MKTAVKRGTANRDWERRWAPIFRAAREGKFPNRAFGTLEMAACIRALRKSRIISRGAPTTR